MSEHEVKPVKLVYRKLEWEVRPGMTLRDAIKKGNIDPQGVLGLREGKLITDDVILREGEVIKLVAVISGG
ncbi:MAG: MoaD/ThiS family protein [Chloroflexi bacterium]|nr:MoaD/ThiS family protein [Chloroflexota bacterium]